MIVCESERLIVRHFNLDDAEFIVKLLNEESFIRYVADKNIRSMSDAENYLKTGPITSYERYGYGLNIVLLRDTETPIGMCGLLKRDELEYPDLGYAFLPDFCGKGFALESATGVLEDGVGNHSMGIVLAVTLPDNKKSNRLLLKLGFKQAGMIELYKNQNNLYQFNVTNNT